MAFDLLRSAKHIRGLNNAEFRVLYFLLDAANQDTYECYPSIKKIARFTDMAERTVQRHITALADRGLFEKVEQRRDDGSRQVNCYRFDATGTVKIGRENVIVLGPQPANNGGLADNPPIPTGPPANTDRTTRQSRRDIDQESEPGIRSDTPPLPLEVDTPRHDDDLFLTGQAVEVRVPSLHEAVLTGWKAMSQQVPAIANIRGMDDSRKRAIAARGRDAVACGADSPQAGWSEIFAAVGRSTFLRGEAAPGKGRQTSFRLTLDFVLKPTNFRKILEGGYDDRHDARTSDPTTGRQYGPAEQAGREGLPSFLAGLEERRRGRAAG